MSDSVVYFGSYGEPESREQYTERMLEAPNLDKWHQSLSSDDINKQFVRWGIIGRRRRDAVVRLLPYLDRGPGGFLSRKGSSNAEIP